ncbi:uncharacterized protein PAC_13454 [Phialocephala subalpina]|uniref:Uncharacterized protein n=1 Tax=Phialocephala subalpina TaxID=576137 RepID=A0A1L7XF27_9HELO|nr:uncharacterized protein PAC_13454 [Phialocephala subalpina]
MTTRRVHKDAPQNPSTRPTSSIQMGEPSPQSVMSPVQLQTPESIETTSSRPSLSRRGSSRTSLPNGPEQDSNQSIPQAKVFTMPKPGRVVKNARAAKKTQEAAGMNVAKHTPSRKQAQAADNAQLGKDAQLSDDIQAAFGTQAALDPQAVTDAVVDWIKRFPTHHDILLIDGETICQQTIIWQRRVTVLNTTLPCG